MSAAKMTTDHEVIRRWVEKHGGRPAVVKRTRSKGDVGMLRVDFPGFSGEETLQTVSWDDWLDKFEEGELAFLYQEGKNTRFNKLVHRDADQVRPSDRRRGPSRTTRGGRAAARALGARGHGRASEGVDRRRKAAGASGTARGRASKTAGARSNGSRGSNGRNGRSSRNSDLHAWTKAELYEKARTRGVPNRSSMSKDELIRALERS